jgi:hypothetical protein
MKISLTTGWQAFNVGFERRRNWNGESFPGLAGFDADFVSSQVDIVPVQSCQIGQSLAGVEPEEDQASPFFIGYFDYTPDLRNREWPASVVGNLAANRFHEFARVFDDIPVPLSRAEKELDGFKVMVGRGSARFLGDLDVWAGSSLEEAAVPDSSGEECRLKSHFKTKFLSAPNRERSGIRLPVKMRFELSRKSRFGHGELIPRTRRGANPNV